MASVMTVMSLSYFCLIIFDASKTVFKYWGHSPLLYLTLSTIIIVLTFIAFSSLVALYLIEIRKIILVRVNFVLFVCWCSLLAFKIVGVIH
jgi:hypothetical protein